MRCPMRALLLLVIVALVVVPAVQLAMSISQATASRVPAVVPELPHLRTDRVPVCIAASEPEVIRPGVSTAPFVPPRA
jgi:hypothetical protein